MAVLRSKRVRALAVVTAIVAAAGSLYWWRRGATAEYVPGEKTDGLVDRLAQRRPDEAPPVRFTEVGEAAGLAFRHFPGERGNRLPEDMGSGVAVGDVDGDGWPDLYFVNNAPPGVAGARCALYRNQGDGTFQDVTDASGAGLEVLGMGAAFLDADGDADLDLFVSAYGTCKLLANDGTGRFTDVSTAAGLDQHVGFWTGIGVADYDGDGAEDVYVCGYVRYEEHKSGAAAQFGVEIPVAINPSTFGPERNLLLRGRGDGTFEEVAEQLGVANANGKGLGVLFTDLNGDRLPDLYVANDVSDNALFENRGDGTFEDRTTSSLAGDYRGAMGLAAADVDGDLDVDLYITHWVGQENALYLSRPPLAGEAGTLYIDGADRMGLGNTALRMVGWATGFFDCDADGWLDLFVVNGSTIPRDDDRSRLQPMRSQLFWHAVQPRPWFHELGGDAGAFFDEDLVGRGGAVLDYDLDGDEDLVVCVFGERPRLLRNEGGLPESNGVRLRLRQPDGDRFALGARVDAQVGDVPRMAIVGTQGSYLSWHTPGELFFGLGGAPRLTDVRVTWPDGTVEALGDLYAGSLVTCTRGARPRIAALPGRGDVHAAPRDVAAQKRFFALRDTASRARLDGDLEAAIADYRAALALWPGHTDVLYYLGNCLLDLGREDAALRAWETLVAFEPRSNSGWMQIGRTRLPGGDPALDDLDAARTAFTRCHEINTEESEPMLQLGVVALLAGDLPLARERLAEVARLNPRSVAARWYGGCAAWRAGDADAAAALLDEARTLAGATGAGASTSNEGDTKTGAALTAEARSLERWRTLAQRPAESPAAEFAVELAVER